MTSSIRRSKLYISALAIVTFILSFLLTLLTTPSLFSLILRYAFDESSKIVLPNDAETLFQNVDFQSNLSYPSRYRSNTYDLYLPKDATEKTPLILWVHGGGFVAGDKYSKTFSYFASQLITIGYAVVSMNYELAPEAHYPIPLFQLNELLTHLYSMKETTLQSIDFTRLSLGGDSAGAHIVSQYAAITTHENAQLENLTPLDISIASLVLYCGPYDLKALNTVDNSLAKFFINQVGWAYLGYKDWESHSSILAEANVISFVDETYPKMFVTDGDTFSFTEHAKSMQETSIAYNRNQDVFYFPFEDDTLLEKNLSYVHEYQFNYQLEASMKCLELTLAFLQS